MPSGLRARSRLNNNCGANRATPLTSLIHHDQTEPMSARRQWIDLDFRTDDLYRLAKLKFHWIKVQMYLTMVPPPASQESRPLKVLGLPTPQRSPVGEITAVGA